MELEKLFGLPAHPLLVHIPVVLVPLAALIAIVFAFKPAWLDRFGWGLVALSGVGALGAILAAGSGEGLESLQQEAETAAREDHFEMGETARNVAILFFLIVTAVVVLRYFARRRAAAGEASTGVWAFIASKAGAIAVAVLLVLSAAGATYTISVAGHQGAKLNWGEDINGGGNDDGGTPAADSDD
ncbi:MAG: DUF2231 domain-containing protein [Ilumatobacteraceae bacterium]